MRINSSSAPAHRASTFLFLAVFGLICTGQTSAQFFPGSAEQEERMKNQMESISNQMLMQQLGMLQHNRGLTEQLEVTEEQVLEVKPIIEEFQESQKQLRDEQRALRDEIKELIEAKDLEGVQELQAEMMELSNKAMETSLEKLGKVFLPHQLDRMRQLGRQQSAKLRAGNDELGIPLALANELGLDRKQRRELEKVTRQELDAYHDAAAELKKKARAKIAEALTPEQREKLHELVGDLYDQRAEMRRQNRARLEKARERQAERKKKEASQDE